MSEAAILLKNARRQAGLTQAQLGLRLGVSQAAVAKLEKSESNPRIATLRDVLRMTGRRLVLAAEPIDGEVCETVVAGHLELSPAQRLAQAEHMYKWGRELERAEDDGQSSRAKKRTCTDESI
ncbi:MAG TPA: helix-turn-helix transcriptional regulator [Solirubrobacteraceae bacterium]|jgi:transcriptional regulator with XRE-family HTH domain